MGQASNSINVPVASSPGFGVGNIKLVKFLPALLPLIGAGLMVAARKKLGPGSMPDDGSLIVIAVLCYISASAALLTNFWAPIRFLERFGLVVGSLGLFFNLSSWLIRWVAAGERENWVRMTNQITGEYHAWWFFSYIPFANLYDLSVAFAFGAGFATMLMSNRPKARFAGALSMPLIALVLLLAVFIGDEFMDLPPVLDSYWRPIHVGVASLSYGVALVSFALSVLYLVKDGIKIESMGIAVTSFLHCRIRSLQQRLFVLHWKLPADPRNPRRQRCARGAAFEPGTPRCRHVRCDIDGPAVRCRCVFYRLQLEEERAGKAHWVISSCVYRSYRRRSALPCSSIE